MYEDTKVELNTVLNPQWFSGITAFYRDKGPAREKIAQTSNYDKFTIEDIFSMWMYVIHPEMMDQYLGMLGDALYKLRQSNRESYTPEKLLKFGYASIFPATI